MGNLEKRINQLVSKWDKPDSPGCAVGAFYSGETIFKAGYGIADLKTGRKISTKTLFETASLSKQFTGMCIGILIEKGDVSFDDDVHIYIPTLPNYKCKVKLKDLIFHTSGITDYLDLIGEIGKSDEDTLEEHEALEIIFAKKDLEFMPGSRHEYSNSNYFLLSQVIKTVSKGPLRDFAQRNLFAPLGMKWTYFNDDYLATRKNSAKSYSRVNRSHFKEWALRTNVVGDGGLNTNIEDFSKWENNYFNNILGKGGPDLIESVTTPGRLNSGKKIGYSFGLELEKFLGLPAISHTGSFLGYQSAMICLPEQKIGAVCLANLEAIDSDYIIREIIRMCAKEFL